MTIPVVPDYAGMLAVALAEARKGLTEGGIPIGAAIFDPTAHSSAPATIAACKMATLPYTAKRTHSATRAASAAIAT